MFVCPQAYSCLVGRALPLPHNYASSRGRRRAIAPPMPRELVWIDQPRFRGWGCSQCAWIFNPLGPAPGAGLRGFSLQTCHKLFITVRRAVVNFDQNILSSSGYHHVLSAKTSMP
jgi:hypothetical protein